MDADLLPPESTMDAPTAVRQRPCCRSLDLRLADCMDVMREFPDKHFDLAIVDPPYGVGVDGQRGDTKTNRIDHEFKGWDSCGPGADYFVELERVAKRWIAWGANCYHPKTSPLVIAWDKMQWSIGAEFELAHTNFTGPNRCFRMCRAQAYCGTDRIHPTQKPVKLYSWLLANYAKPGDRILDTHMGSGSIAIAAHYAGIHLTACEIDPDYYEAAKARIARETAQLDFFSSQNA